MAHDAWRQDTCTVRAGSVHAGVRCLRPGQGNALVTLCDQICPASVRHACSRLGSRCKGSCAPGVLHEHVLEVEQVRALQRRVHGRARHVVDRLDAVAEAPRRDGARQHADLLGVDALR